MPGLLDGIRILEVSAFHNGTAAGAMLGDLGAEVIKIEPPVVGDPYRGFEMMAGTSTSVAGRVIPFELANRNKKSITLDLKAVEGQRVLSRLLAESDVFITNYRAAVLQKLGIDYETLAASYPRLVYLQASTYGPQGPEADQRGFDMLPQARSGIMWAAGDRDHQEPWQFVGGLFDQLGSIISAWGITTALFYRDRTGKGQLVQTSLLGSALHLQALNVSMVGIRKWELQRHSRHRARNPMANHYPCADGKWIMISELQSDRFWNEFCGALGIAEIEKDHRFESAVKRRDHCIELNRLVEEVFRSKPREEWLTIFRARRVEFVHTPILTLKEAIEDPHATENRYVVDYEYPDVGKVQVPGFPIHFSAAPGEIQSLAPELGQHTEEILIERLGYSWEDVARLREECVI